MPQPGPWQCLPGLTSTPFPVLLSWAVSCPHPGDLGSDNSLLLSAFIRRPNWEQAHGRPLMKTGVPFSMRAALARAVGTSSGELGPLWDQHPPIGGGGGSDICGLTPGRGAAE